MLKITEWALRMSGNVEAALEKINGKADGTSRKFMVLQDKIGGMESRFGGLKSIIAGALSGIAVTAFLNSSVTAFDSQAKANAQLQAALLSTKGIAQQTFEGLEAQAAKLQKITLFEDDSTMGAQALLLTFTKVRGAIYEKAIPAVLDYATAMKTEPTQAAMQLGKALNDPILGISALRRAGVQFSDSQQAMIKKFVETNQLAKAQEIILGELNTQFGGSAEAAAKAGMGPLTLIRNAFSDSTEQLGELIAMLLTKLYPTLTKITESFTAGLTWIKTNLGLVVDVVQSLAIAASIVAGWLLVWNANTIILTVAQWALNAAMLANPVYLVIAAIVALIAGIVLLWKRSEEFRGFLYGFWESVKFIFTSIATMIRDVFMGWTDMITGMLTFDGSKFLSGITKMFDSVKGTVAKVGGETGAVYRKNFAIGAAEVASDLTAEKTRSAASPSGSYIPNAGSPTPESDEAIKKGASSITDGTKQVRNVTVTINKLVEKLEIHTSNLQGVSNSELESKITEILLRAVQGSELVLR